MMSGVTGEATGLGTGVLITAEILMASCAMGAHCRRARIGEAEDFRGIAIAIDMGSTRTVTAFTALLVGLGIRKQLLVGGLHDAGKKLIMTGLAGFSAHIGGGLLLSGETGSE
jgi:hypothetical protein